MDCDFIVIGGGIAGLSAGAALAELGRVVVWEAEADLGYHASGRSAALFEESYGLPAVVALNRASRAAHGAAGHLSPRGLMLVGLVGEEAAFEADLAAMELQELDRAAARSRVSILSDAVTRVAFHEDASDLDTDAMLQGHARVIRRAGGAVRTGRRVDQVQRSQGGWHVRAGPETIAARILVNAAGAWADQMAQRAGIDPLGLTPMRRSMARLAAPGGRDVRAWPMLMGVGERWYAKPDAGAWIVSPAEEDPSEPLDAFADDMVLAEGLDRYQRAVTEPVTRPRATWAGLRTFTPDRCLALGPAPQDAAFIWVAGQGGYGFQTSPAAARLVADRIAGRPSELDPDLVSALDPERFA
ncbi:MAG: FAD-binding oxidoreductase [Pseudomonadota bacterium]